MKPHRIFRLIWWFSNLLLAVAIASAAYTSVWEYSVRRYLRGFSDAVVPEAAAPRLKVEAILTWMRVGPPRLEVQSPAEVSSRDPQDTLNYRQLMEVCGSATNAFLNLARSAGLQARRLLLLGPDRRAKHVVAEVLLNGRWVVVDPTYRTLFKDGRGNLLTRKDLQNPVLFREATSSLSGYRPEYTYEKFAHVRLGALPLRGAGLRYFLDRAFPAWDEYLDWSLLLERRSFLCFFLAVNSLIVLLLARIVLAWLADHRLRVSRFHLRANLGRATATFFSTPEIK